MSVSERVESVRAESVLVNFVFAHPVGHAIEALHYAYGYYLADQNRHVAVALNAATPTELAELCPFIQATYPIQLDLFAERPDVPGLLREVPRRWDHVLADYRGRHGVEREVFPGLAAYYDGCATYLEAGTLTDAGATPPSYQPPQDFRLVLPEAARDRAEERLGAARPRIAILPGGSAARHAYPSAASWQLILRALTERFPDATFCFVGKLAHDDRTRTTFSAAELDGLIAASPRATEAIDIPLTEQLAMVASCDVLISPHSGLGMAALAAGTPWLTIAGNRWPEYYFNGTPFYSVLPDLDRFPCYTLHGPEPALVDDDGPRSPSMSRERLKADLDEIVEGSARLIERTWPYETAMRDHCHRMLRVRDGDASLLYSVDSVHIKYLP